MAIKIVILLLVVPGLLLSFYSVYEMSFSGNLISETNIDIGVVLLGLGLHIKYLVTKRQLKQNA